MGRRLDYNGDNLIFRKGDPADFVYLVLKGRVVLEKDSGESEESLGEIFPGQIFGELAVIGNETRICSARAAEPTEVVRFRRSEISELIGHDAGVLDLFFQAMATRIKLLADKLNEVTT
ncbi:MAG: cyclic nucleotide-binding domain-containing protein [Turneriella sp.]|nr:cyclic nucleotide-binding domain-containing protein [Turneriella sp.]